MRKRSVCLAACIVLLTTSALAQNFSFAGTWKLDVKQSDFGSEPAPKSITVTLLKDTPKMLSIRGHGIDDQGKSFSYSWSGPEDGSMQPMTNNGKVEGKQSARKEGDTLVRHGENPDGSSFDARATISGDGNMATEEVSMKSKDGKETKQKTVWHRIQ